MTCFKIAFSADGNVRTKCLRAAKVPLMNQALCKQMYSDSSSGLIDGQICAGYTAGDTKIIQKAELTDHWPDIGMVDTCHGDSGGPLACQVTVLVISIWTLFPRVRMAPTSLLEWSTGGVASVERQV